VTNTRAQVLVEVQQAYYQALAARSILTVAQATVDLRRPTLRQVGALAQSLLRSTLGVSFAQLNVSQAELDLYRADSDDSDVPGKLAGNRCGGVLHSALHLHHVFHSANGRVINQQHGFGGTGVSFIPADR